MSQLMLLESYSSVTGDLTVFEKVFPEHIKRLSFVTGENESYGGYRHKTTKVALVCVTGQCRVNCKNGILEKEYKLDSAQKCLLLQPEDWFLIDRFSEDAKLLVLANQPYSDEEMIHEPFS